MLARNGHHFNEFDSPHILKSWNQQHPQRRTMKQMESTLKWNILTEFWENFCTSVRILKTTPDQIRYACSLPVLRLSAFAEGNLGLQLAKNFFQYWQQSGTLQAFMVYSPLLYGREETLQERKRMQLQKRTHQECTLGSTMFNNYLSRQEFQEL